MYILLISEKKRRSSLDIPIHLDYREQDSSKAHGPMGNPREKMRTTNLREKMRTTSRC